MENIDVAKEQLVTALDLFLHDKSPVSVHSLSCNAREILERLCKAKGIRSFTEHIKDTFPDEEIYNILHKFRNPFKHSDNSDSKILKDFSDKENDHILFIAIEDYVNFKTKATIEMQVFHAWYCAINQKKLAPKKLNELRNVINFFNHLFNKSRNQQKVGLLEIIAEQKNSSELMGDIGTERE